MIKNLTYTLIDPVLDLVTVNITGNPLCHNSYFEILPFGPDVTEHTLISKAFKVINDTDLRSIQLSIHSLWEHEVHYGFHGLAIKEIDVFSNKVA